MEVDYQRALEIELNKRGLAWQREVVAPGYGRAGMQRRVEVSEGECG